MGFQGRAIEPSLKPLFGKNAWSFHNSLCRRRQGILDDILALLLMGEIVKTPEFGVGALEKGNKNTPDLTRSRSLVRRSNLPFAESSQICSMDEIS